MNIEGQNINLSKYVEEFGIVGKTTFFTRIRVLRENGLELTLDRLSAAACTEKQKWAPDTQKIRDRLPKPSELSCWGIEPFSAPCKTYGCGSIE